MVQLSHNSDRHRSPRRRELNDVEIQDDV
jgi:hypothetical protein